MSNLKKITITHVRIPLTPLIITLGAPKLSYPIRHVPTPKIPTIELEPPQKSKSQLTLIASSNGIFYRKKRPFSTLVKRQIAFYSSMSPFLSKTTLLPPRVLDYYNSTTTTTLAESKTFNPPASQLSGRRHMPNRRQAKPSQAESLPASKAFSKATSNRRQANSLSPLVGKIRSATSITHLPSLDPYLPSPPSPPQLPPFAQTDHRLRFDSRILSSSRRPNYCYTKNFDIILRHRLTYPS